ncbi:TPA: PH domain-containing protein [Staphylococcus aureus]
MSDYTKLTKSPKSALLYYYITNGLEFILSVAVYVIFYFIWLRFEWPHYLLYILLVLGALSTLKLFIKPLWQYHCRFYKVDQLSKVLNLYKVGFMTAGHTIYLPMMSHDDVKIIEERTMSNLRGVESDV